MSLSKKIQTRPEATFQSLGVLFPAALQRLENHCDEICGFRQFIFIPRQLAMGWLIVGLRSSAQPTELFLAYDGWHNLISPTSSKSFPMLVFVPKPNLLHYSRLFSFEIPSKNTPITRQAPVKFIKCRGNSLFTKSVNRAPRKPNKPIDKQI